jgi:ATP-binding cassette subfamily C protein LapB
VTAQRVVALDVQRPGPGLTAAPGAPPLRPGGPALSAVPDAPAVAPSPRSRAEARADLASLYARVLGQEVPAADILDRLPAAERNGAPGLEALAAALKTAGLAARVAGAPRARADLWPALAEMAGGQVVLVLSQTGATLTLYDPTCPDARAEVAAAEFDRVFAGRVLIARQTLAALAARHALPGAAPHWFWGELMRHRRPMIEVAAGSLVANLLAVAVALFSLQVYDRVIPHQSEPTLWVLALGAVLAVGLEGLLKSARAALIDATGKRVEIAVQTALMGRLLGMRAAPGDRRPSELFSAMREFSSVREFFTATTIGTVADLPFLIIFFLLVASIGGPVVWILIIGGVLMVAPGLLFQKRMMALTAATQGAATRSVRLLHETIHEAETLATQRGEDRVKRLWAEMTALMAAKSSDQRRLTAALTHWAQGVQQVTYVAAVVAGAYLVFAGAFTVGTIIAVGILTGRTLGPLSQLAATLARWSNVRAALDALDAIAHAPQVEDPARAYLRRDRLSGAFELRGLSFRYDPKGAPVVDIPALAVLPGQKVAVLGANGSGKSTLLRLLAGLYEPGQGRVLLDGVDMGQIHPRDLRRGLGYLAQEVRLLAGSLRDNLNLHGLERDDDRLLAALDFAGLGPFVRAHPRGLDLPIHEGGEGLSVGQRQSIGWARLWLQDPPVAILDEPTAALDQTLEATVVARLGPWLAARTAVIATHRVPILSLATRILVLQNGRLAVDGPRDAVLARLAKGPGA